jgi:glycerol uptake facilitator-like aquaporin
VNGTGNSVLNGSITIWNAVTGNMPGTNVKPYALPIAGRFIGQAGASMQSRWVLTHLRKGLGTATGSIQGKIVSLSLDTVGGENTGN